MPDYLDSNRNVEWNVSKDKVTLNVNHNSHRHSLDLTNTTLEELQNNTNQTLGDAHRKADHTPI